MLVTFLGGDLDHAPGRDIGLLQISIPLPYDAPSVLELERRMLGPVSRILGGRGKWETSSVDNPLTHWVILEFPHWHAVS